MAKTLRGREVKLAVGQITQVEGVWFRVHKISKRDITFRRLNAEQVVNVERVKAAQEKRVSEGGPMQTGGGKPRQPSDHTEGDRNE